MHFHRTLVLIFLFLNHRADAQVASGHFRRVDFDIIGQSEAIAVADVNGDGAMDLLRTRSNGAGDGASFVIHANDGSGGFPYATTVRVDSIPFRIVPAELNGDDQIAAVTLARGNGGLQILTNGGGGQFTIASGTDLFPGAVPRGVAAADFNGDGQNDVVVASVTFPSPYSGTLTILTNGGGGFNTGPAPPAANDLSDVAAADVNGDKRPDIITANYSSSTLSVFTNRGEGTFALASSPGVGIGPTAVTAADVNRDGKTDLITANSSAGTLTVLTNQGNGIFAVASSPPVGEQPEFVTAADLNADGKMDLVAVHDPQTTTVLTNNGVGGFTVASSTSSDHYSEQAVAADLDNDGLLDLVLDTPGGQKLTILFNIPNVQPRVIGRFDTPGFVTGIGVSSNYAYAADGAAGLQILDVSEPDNPRIVGNVTGIENVFDVVVSGTFAYVVHGEGLAILDIDDPAQPQLLGNYGASPSDLSVVGHFAYLAGPEGIHVIDVSNPTLPLWIGGYTNISALRLAIKGTNAYIVSAAGFHVFDISDPIAPQLISTLEGVPSPDSFSDGIAVSGNVVLVGDYDLTIIDVSDRIIPQVIKSFPSLGIPLDVAIVDTRAYLAMKADDDHEKFAGLEILDISNPTDPVSIGFVATARGWGVTVSGKYAYLAEVAAGVTVIEIDGMSPRLSFRATNNTLVLSWPTNTSDFVLESAEQLDFSAKWTRATNVASRSGRQWTISTPSSGIAKFFRLRKP